jgi:hypothetical protein
MPCLGTKARLVSVFVMLTWVDPLAAQQAATTGNQSPAVNAGGHVTITYASMTAEEKAAFARQVAETLLGEMRGKGASAVGPGADQRVEQAVTGIAKGASEGDARLQQALNLLAAGNGAQLTGSASSASSATALLTATNAVAPP